MPTKHDFLYLCGMGNLVYVKNRFLTSCYELVVRMGSSLVQDWKGYIRKSHFSWRLERVY